MEHEKSTLPVVLGAMTFGEEGREQVRVHDYQIVKQIIDIFGSHAHREIDTAR
jgi:aflatoxin B1 aldehyde reductase